MTRSSPESCGDRFAIEAEQTVGLKWLILNKHNKWVPLIPREISFGQNVSKLVFGVDVFDLDLGVQINSIKHPIKCNSVSHGNMSHRRTPSFHDHLDYCFIVFEHIQ